MPLADVDGLYKVNSVLMLCMLSLFMPREHNRPAASKSSSLSDCFISSFQRVAGIKLPRVAIRLQYVPVSATVC
jgi:hypothetical protein